MIFSFREPHNVVKIQMRPNPRFTRISRKQGRHQRTLTFQFLGKYPKSLFFLKKDSPLVRYFLNPDFEAAGGCPW